jgi:uncharacterized cupredoxin-like copper-binding protein
MSRPYHALLVLAAAASIAGCDGTTHRATDPSSPGVAAGQAVAVAVSPNQAAVAPGAVVPFAATVTGTANTSVAWGVVEAGGGSVTSTGLYTAPASGGTFHVTATSAADSTKSATATVTVTAPPVVAITITPVTGTVNACQTLQLTATVTGSTDTAATWSVQEGAAGGTVSAAGLYTAPSGPGIYHVVATSHADPTKTATATVTVNEVILAVAVSPSTVTVAPGGTAQLTATVTNSCGSYTAKSTLLSNGTIIPN